MNCGHPERLKNCVSICQHPKRATWIGLIAIIFLTCNAVAPLPSVAQNQVPAIPQLTGDFTLKYAGIQTEHQTSAHREETYRILADGVDASLEQGGMTRIEADKAKAELRERSMHDAAPYKFSALLSMHNGKLFYGISGSKPTILIWDGKNSYVYDALEATLLVKPGLGFISPTQVPCPGIGLPGLPLIRLPTPGGNDFQLRGEIFTNYIFPSGPYYMPGTLHYVTAKDGAMQLTSSEWWDGGQLTERHEFSGATRLNNVLLPRHTQFLRYRRGDRPTPGKALPVGLRTEYELVSFSDTALADDQFEPTTHFKTNSRPSITWGVPNHTVSFRFDPTKTLEQQSNEQFQLEKLEADRQDNLEGKRHGIAGPLLLTLLLVGTVWWLLRRKGSSAR